MSTKKAKILNPKIGKRSLPYILVLPMVLMMVVFYFLLIRPQQKKEKLRIKMIDSLQKGDRVVVFAASDLMPEAMNCLGVN